MPENTRTDRRRQLLAIAQRHFFEKGYTATGLREIASDAGIEAASVYAHYASKNEILLAIAEATADAFEQAVRPVFQSEMTVPVKLSSMIVEHMEVIARNQEACAVFFIEWKHLEEPARSAFSQRRNQYQAMFEQVIAQGIRENQFKDYDDRFIARVVLSALNWTYTWYTPSGELSAAQIGKQISQIILQGINRNM